MTEIAITARTDDLTKEADRNCLFSRAEIDFLKGIKTVSSNYQRVLLHRIFRKLEFFKCETLPILARNQKTRSWVENVTVNCNRITGFCNIARNDEMLPNSLFFQNSGKLEWTGGDLNPRPPECKSGVHTS